MQVKTIYFLVACLIIFAVIAIVFAALYLKSLNVVKGYNNENLMNKVDLTGVDDGMYQGKAKVGDLSINVIVEVKNHEIVSLNVIGEGNEDALKGLEHLEQVTSSLSR